MESTRKDPDENKENDDNHSNVDSDFDYEDYMENECTHQSSDPYPGIEKKREILKFWQGKTNKRLSFETVQQRYRKLKSPKTLHRWKKALENGGTKNDKLNEINDYLLTKFNDARSRGNIVHDRNLQNWALETNAKVQLNDFKGSSGWILLWKKRNKVTLKKLQ